MKEKKRGKKAGSIAIVVVLIALALLVGYNVMQVKHIRVVGNDQIGSDAIAQLAAIPEKTEMLQVDEKQLKSNIEANPYLVLAHVDYELPDTVVLTVTERTPAALLSAGNSFLLLDRQLIVLKDNDNEDAGKYPLIAGIAVQSAELGKQVSTDETAKILPASAILDELKKQNAAALVTQINLTDINNIVLKTKNGPDVLFGQMGEEAAKIAWIVRLLPDFIAQGKTTGVIDVSAANSATYGSNHMPAPTQTVQAPVASAQTGQSAGASPTQTGKGPGASPSAGVSSSVSLKSSAKAS